MSKLEIVDFYSSDDTWSNVYPIYVTAVYIQVGRYPGFDVWCLRELIWPINF